MATAEPMLFPGDIASKRAGLDRLNSAFFLRTDAASDSSANSGSEASRIVRANRKTSMGESTMGSWLNSVRSFEAKRDAKRRWGVREWQIYEDLPWPIKRIADVLVHVPRFSSLTGEIEKADRRTRLVERKLSEAKLRPIEKG